jgi:hypothetical protein
MLCNALEEVLDYIMMKCCIDQDVSHIRILLCRRLSHSIYGFRNLAATVNCPCMQVTMRHGVQYKCRTGHRLENSRRKLPPGGHHHDVFCNWWSRHCLFRQRHWKILFGVQRGNRNDKPLLLCLAKYIANLTRLSGPIKTKISHSHHHHP